MARTLDDIWKKRFVLPVSLVLFITGFLILGRDLLRAVSALLWSTQLATTTTTGGQVQMRIIMLIDDYPIKLGSYNWLVGGLLAALGLFGLMMALKHRPKKQA